jgi:hypothetical protein
MNTSKNEIVLGAVERQILIIRGQKVILDSDLAALYGVTTGNLNLAVKRNIKRFPEDFMFQLNQEEAKILILQNAISSSDKNDEESLRSQNVTSKNSYGGRRHFPYAFTEQGIAMLSSVLSSDRAIQANIAIMRAFVRLHKMLTSNENLARKIIDMEQKYDKQFRVVFMLFEHMENEEEDDKPPIGFTAPSESEKKKKRKT